jgi:hypothetical protein
MFKHGLSLPDGGRSHTLSLWHSARQRAKRRGIPFDLKPADIVIPETCPVLGIPLFRGVGTLGPNSPSIDQVVIGKGYVPNNICVISHRANALKRDGTVEELEKVIAYMKGSPS